MEPNSLSTKTPGILGSCCLSRCINSAFPLQAVALTTESSCGLLTEALQWCCQSWMERTSPACHQAWSAKQEGFASFSSISATSWLCTLNSCWVQFPTSASSSASSPAAAEPTVAAARISLCDKEELFASAGSKRSSRGGLHQCYTWCYSTSAQGLWKSPPLTYLSELSSAKSDCKTHHKVHEEKFLSLRKYYWQHELHKKFALSFLCPSQQNLIPGFGSWLWCFLPKTSLNPGVPCGSSWHPGPRACLLERHELILLSCLNNGILRAADQFASSYTEMTLTDIQELLCTVRGSKCISQLCRILDEPLTTTSHFWPECYF